VKLEKTKLVFKGQYGMKKKKFQMWWELVLK